MVRPMLLPRVLPLISSHLSLFKLDFLPIYLGYDSLISHEYYQNHYHLDLYVASHLYMYHRVTY